MSRYDYWFSCLKGISGREKRRLLGKYRSAEALYYIEETRLKEEGISEKGLAEWRKRGQWEFQKKEEGMKRKGIRLVCCHSPEYPRRLRELPGMPFALYVRGKLPADELPSVAIVGARQCTSYGETMAIRYGEALAEAGIQVISGMAKGIDSAGQRGALNGGGKSFAVLGCGADVCYPGENRGLYRDLQVQGGVLSEYPPGTRPLPGYFPARNRIISALADVVLVMEAREKSGSLITADMALEQGRDVYALPGAADSPLSRGCHGLIRQGAGILISPEEFLRETGWILPGKEKELAAAGAKEPDKNKKMLENTEKLVYSKLALYPKGKEELLLETGLEPARLTATLVSLELKGYICEKAKNYYSRRG